METIWNSDRYQQSWRTMLALSVLNIKQEDYSVSHRDVSCRASEYLYKYVSAVCYITHARNSNIAYWSKIKQDKGAFKALNTWSVYRKRFSLHQEVTVAARGNEPS